MELRDSGVQQNLFLIRDGFWLSRNLGHVKLCNYLLNVYPPRDLMDALRSTVAALDTLEIVSVHFPSVGVPMQCKLLGWCEAATACVSTLRIWSTVVPACARQSTSSSRTCVTFGASRSKAG